MNTVYIYTLINPIDNSIFYVGATAKPDARLYNHVTSRRKDNTYKGCVIRDLYSNGMRPEMIVVDECERKDTNFWEEFYINLFISFGFTLNQNKYSGYTENNRESIKFSTRQCKNGIIAELKKELGGYVRKCSILYTKEEYENSNPRAELESYFKEQFS